jgi:HKD family nuclease
MTEVAVARVRLLVLPYASLQGESLVQLLVNELGSARWSRFAAAVAFAKHSGNYVEFLDALRKFSEAGNTVELTFGGNTFGAEAAGSEYEAIESLLRELQKTTDTKIFLYREAARTFHPKIYLFDNNKDLTALLVVGSSNWTDGGLRDNVEANVVIDLDLTKKDQKTLHQQVRSYFEDFWQEKQGP